MLDSGGQDATEAFEDVGHSDEAREILDGMVVGTLKRMVSPPPNPLRHNAASIPPATHPTLLRSRSRALALSEHSGGSTRGRLT
jgi:cytochrome b involved in lipid metabolism